MTLRFPNSRLVLDVTGQQHEAFDNDIRVFLNAQADWFSVSKEDEGWRVLRYHRLAEPPLEWNVRFGQLAQGIREALDYLVFTLSEENGGEPDAPDARTQWPIFTERDKYPRWRSKMLRGIPEPERAVIDWLQPFDRPDDSLAILDRLTNTKKHQQPAPRFVLAEPASLSVFPADERPVSRSEVLLRARPGVPLEPDTEIGRVRLPDEPERKVHVNFEANVTLAFGEDRVTPQALSNIGSRIAWIVERFEVFRSFWEPPPPMPN